MTNITERAMLVSMNIRAWTARKHDKKITEEVADQHGAKRDVGRYNKILVPKTALANVFRIAGEARAKHYEVTLPWLDAGVRILPSALYLDYTKEQQRLKEAFEKAAADFIAAYPDLKKQAKADLNGMFREADYPTVYRLERMFHYDVGFAPLPDAADFRVSLSTKETARVRKSIEARCNEAFREATRDLWTRIHEVVSHFNERLKIYEPGTDDARATNPFRDTLVGNIIDLVDLLPKLNVTADPELEAMTLRLRDTLCKADPTQLREDSTIREAAVQTSDDILAAMAGYIGDVA